MISINQVYTELREALNIQDASCAITGLGIAGRAVAGKEYYLKTYCTRRRQAVPKFLPCMYFEESHFRNRRYITLDYDDKQITSTVRIELYARDEQIEVMLDAIETAMNAMHYIEENCIQIDNADINVIRYTMTFSRIICEGDTLDEVS